MAKPMKYYEFFIFIITLSIAACTHQNAKSLTQKDILLENEIDKYISTFEQFDLFNGTILIVRDGSILVNKGYGLANYEHDIYNTPDTKFRIASLSKPFTRLAILQLSEANKLKLNDPLSKFIPDYPNGDMITITHLLNHSSGIPHINDFSNYDIMAKNQYSVSEIIALFKDKPLDYQVGARETYSNSGYVLLVDIIEKTSGLTYENYLEEFIFRPAGMKNSGHDNGTTLIKNMAAGYMMNLSGTGLQHTLYYSPSIKIGGGSLYSTTHDLYAFTQAYSRGKLSKSTKPLFDEGLIGTSPGYHASMWARDGVFISILSNNYNTPIRLMAEHISMIMLGRDTVPLNIKAIKIDTEMMRNDYEGQYTIGNDIETIEVVNGVLIEYENGDKYRGCRLIPIGTDSFFDTCYMEKLIFQRGGNHKVTSFTWESGDIATRISTATLPTQP